ncbi:MULTISPECIES: hypothetical protein [unclassified Microbacterium]|uniref:hypothetical protein n=1 Tax=unclassified Microbacterium TaxID=2609290 RepID=UPI001604CC8C|nr:MULTISPECIES: hypothetical protein [unclassified Microbacterium]QNA91846.1 hypothetical protein G4G29_04255 [Microbacterium sp. Se63.02b]QYM65063.1 hypothetical protein K1X59_04275 [Microbacterium sp. Se5.02b]
MKVRDLLIGVPREFPSLQDEENPFLHADALIGAQITRVIVDVLGGAVGVLLELRQSTRLRGNTALLRVTGVAQQNWVCARTANEFTAWSITAAVVHQHEKEVQFVADCLPVGTLRIVGSAADFTLLDAAALPTAPPDYRADPRALIRFGIADESTEVELIGVARSEGARPPASPGS